MRQILGASAGRILRRFRPSEAAAGRLPQSASIRWPSGAAIMTLSHGLTSATRGASNLLACMPSTMHLQQEKDVALASTDEQIYQTILQSRFRIRLANHLATAVRSQGPG